MRRGKPLPVKAHHESAHAVLEMLHGSLPRSVRLAVTGDSGVVSGWGDGSRDAQGRPFRDAATKRAVEAAIVELYAGAVGVTRYLHLQGEAASVTYEGGRLLSDGFEGHSSDDEHARTLAWQTWPRSWRSRCADLLTRSVALVEVDFVWAAILDIANILEQRLELAGAELAVRPPLRRALAEYERVAPARRRSLHCWTSPSSRI